LEWYHTLALPGGVVTAGDYDLRRTTPLLPWPELTGSRCLDIGTRDGFYAFEMERRGAEEVVAVDIDDPDAVDFPEDRPDAALIRANLEDGARAFACAKQALRSGVVRTAVSVYDLDAADIGTFDFALMGTLLHHLRDPLRALTAVRRVVRGHFMMVPAITPGLDALRRRPIAEIEEIDGPFWSIANPAGYRRWLQSTGFVVLSVSRPFFIPRGPGLANPSWRSTLRRPVRDIGKRLVLRRGLPHVALLAR
jgi:tRNA (mo5U34)-methyltransferase